MNRLLTFSVLTFLTLLFSCYNRDNDKTNKNQNDSTYLQNDSLQKEITTNTKDKYFGDYIGQTMDKTEMKPTIRLTSPDSFHMDVNLCEGEGHLKGTFFLLDSIIKFKVTYKDFYGFLGENQNEFSMTISSDSTLIYNGSMIGCYPRPHELFQKTKKR